MPDHNPEWSYAVVYDPTRYKWWRNPIMWYKRRRFGNILATLDLTQEQVIHEKGVTIKFVGGDEDDE